MKIKDLISESAVSDFESLLKNKHSFLTKLSIKKTGTSLDVDRIDIDPKHQGKGYGKQVMLEIIDWAQKNGYSDVKLVPEGDVIQFYVKLGFKKASRHSQMYVLKLNGV